MSISGKRKADQFILSLIEEVKSHECLWNIHKMEYTGRGVMARAWIDIANKLQNKVPVIRAKWKNLRDAYRKEVKKNIIDDQYHGIWLYFEKLDFLRSTVEIADSNDSETVEGFHLDDSQSIQDEDTTMSFVTSNENSSPPPMKRKREEYGTDTMFVNGNGEVMIDSKTNAVEEEKYDEQFLISLLPFLRRLDPVRKLMIRSKIQAAVVEELTQSNRDPIGN